jgi:transposase
MAKVHSIQTLHARGWFQRRIARELGVHRETVARYVQLPEHRPRAGPDSLIRPDQNRPNPPTGSAADEPDGAGGIEACDAGSAAVQNRPNLPAGSSGPASLCEPFREVILAALERGLSYQRIWQDLKTERGFGGGYDSVKRFCRRLKQTTPLPFRRMECEPGAEAQVDFGTAAPVITPEGKRRRPHLFRIVLSHSRKAYSEAVYRQTTDDFLRCLENAFQHFGGVPKTLVIDNLKAAVTKADWFDPDLNPKILAFCEHYGTVVLPTKVRTPRHKGKVERGVAVRPGQRPQGSHVPQSARAEPPSIGLGDERRRHPHPRHDPPAGRQGLRRGRTGDLVAAAGRAIPLLPRGAAHRQS